MKILAQIEGKTEELVLVHLKPWQNLDDTCHASRIDGTKGFIRRIREKPKQLTLEFATEPEFEFVNCDWSKPYVSPFLLKQIEDENGIRAKLIRNPDFKFRRPTPSQCATLFLFAKGWELMWEGQRIYWRIERTVNVQGTPCPYFDTMECGEGGKPKRKARQMKFMEQHGWVVRTKDGWEMTLLGSITERIVGEEWSI